MDVKDVFGRTWHVHVERLEPGRHLTCVDRAMGFLITSTDDVVPDATGDGATIHHVIELGGRLQRIDRPLHEGAIMRVKAAYGAVDRCEVCRQLPGRVLGLVVRPRGLVIVNSYSVEPAQEGSHIRHGLLVARPLAGATRLTLRDRYERRLDAEVRSVAAVAARS